MRIAAAVVLKEEDREILERWSRGRSLAARLVERSRIVLMASEGKQDLEIAAELGISNQKAARWRKRFLEAGLKGLEKDAPRPGRTPSIGAARVQVVIDKTTQSKPAHATHWSTRTMAAEVGISEASVRRIWRASGLKHSSGEYLQGEQRPSVCRETGSHCGSIPEPTGTCPGFVRG